MSSSKSKTLVIVESPAKAATIEKYLGGGYHVVSSFGHIRDLPKSKLGVDVEKDFEPSYIVPRAKQKVATALKQEAKKAAGVLFASDEDREGEAIAWHIAGVLELAPDKAKRISFTEITKEAVTSALKSPRPIDINLVDAQQARRVLDRLVGYELSPLLWKKVRRGLSAGRVQSVAVRLIVERENEITGFAEQRYFGLIAQLKHAGVQFEAKAASEIDSKQEAADALMGLAKARLSVSEVKSTPQTRKAPAPFTTSTLQQAAASRLGFSVKQTMTLAQKLYEAGHITYMRTDSLNLSASAKNAIREYVSVNYGEKYLGAQRSDKAAKGAQEAHEAIRPTNVKVLKPVSDSGQQRLYKLIWQRTVASQMAAATLDKTDIRISGDGTIGLVATGIRVTFPGFLLSGERAIKENELPPIEQGEVVEFVSAEAQEKLRKPPSRYSEATLVRALEKLGIGRPSTYAPTISTIQDRGYVAKQDSPGSPMTLVRLSVIAGGQPNEETIEENYGADKKRLSPTDIGIMVNDFLTSHFKTILDYEFTAGVEAQFDKIASGELNWREMIKEFYQPFHKQLTHIDDTVSRSDTGSIRELGKDPASGEMVYARFGRFGPVIQLGKAEKDGPPPKFAPFPAGRKLEEITFEEAQKMLTLPRVVGRDESGQEITATIGRYGPYIKVDKNFVSIDEDQIFTLDEATARELIKQAGEQKSKSQLKVFEGEGISIKTGRYGPYVTDGKINASVPKKLDPNELTLEQAKELLEKKKQRTSTKG